MSVPALVQRPEKPIHVAVAFDQNYMQPFCSLLNSLITNHSPGDLVVHTIAEGISTDDRRRILARMENTGNAIYFYDVDPSLVSNLVARGKWTRVAYYRLFFPDLLPDTIDRILYLDADTVVVSSLWSLYTQDLEGNPVAAVYDNYVKRQPLIGIPEEDNYFNSGVLLIDSARWKSLQISQKAAEYIVDHPERIIFVDQCALNAVLYRNWKKLDHRFNLMYSLIPEGISRKALYQYMKGVVVVHFTLQRPWHMLCRNRLRHLYFLYLNKGRIFAWNRYTDFEVKKIPSWIKIRVTELYFDTPAIQKLWRSWKRK